jgi:hypothetical protein
MSAVDDQRPCGDGAVENAKANQNGSRVDITTVRLVEK